MGAYQTKLTTKEILEKDFKVTMRGYHQEEVDEFLDTIIQDYEVLQQEIDRLRQENEQLQKRSTEGHTRAQNNGSTQVNYDVLKRLSNLEKVVFGKKYTNAES